ncbi:hypothetical protein Arnit_1710 [Arcobacter nitrofigilis DSM 7299]|uniref:Uncharacterized protein n=1 Tax=Arcobacter nitrofigilis (strain ATCC 33309 / DSM 7299 / CCUG 15893 / LMG 7604 / NCTC 12251 / CI) TaxID=572480 RepID=D5UZZ5_ARCNC|nr:hypothetical protein [Arcobacter nitrofigilis]ADG93364.1 hypothetical protein Arnit_1710 [Arcobacter nitrofigilis DSM 7299]
MELESTLKDIEKKCSKVAYLCVIHMIDEKFNNKNIENISLLKDFFIDYENYETFLNDYASVIYNKFDSSKEEVYNEICSFFDENPDNKYLFLFRLKKLSSQNPLNYINIEDEDTRANSILKLENRINIIESSTYYKENTEELSNDIIKIKKSLEVVKAVAGIK